MKNFALLLLLLVVLDHVAVAEIDYIVVGVVDVVGVIAASFSFHDVGTNQEHIHHHFLHSH